MRRGGRRWRERGERRRTAEVGRARGPGGAGWQRRRAWCGDEGRAAEAVRRPSRRGLDGPLGDAAAGAGRSSSSMLLHMQVLL